LIDEARIYVKAGDGGDGAVAFRREAHVPRGGPSGGNGGKGADVYLVADPQVKTLIPFTRQQHFRAPGGEAGRGKNQTGASGEDLLIVVPVGTTIFDAETGDQLADLVRPGQRALIVRGGRGGRGNRTFRSPTNQAPRIAERGEPAEERWLRLELKLLADAGIIGMPNAGKSTLLSIVSAARPKIADYPFTTLEPNLGVVLVDDRDYVLADIPGLIEGAHAGAGLGLAFLRHIERTRVLIHLLNGLSPDPLGDYDAVNQELALFRSELAGKPQIVALNKMDLPDVRERWPEIAAGLKARGVAEPMAISAATGEGTNDLIRRVAAVLAETPSGLPAHGEPGGWGLRPALAAESAEPPEVITVPAEDRGFTITREPDGGWRVKGRHIERIVAMTRWEYYDAVMRFQRILEAVGITNALRAKGVEPGETVRIGDMELEWYD
jgi:GTP-binding protein